MAVPINTSNFKVIDEWPIPGGLPRGGLHWYLVRCTDHEVLLCNDAIECCLHLNLKDRTKTQMEWPKPEWAKVQERNGNVLYERGARDIAVCSEVANPVAAVATKANYAFYWQVGTHSSKIIERGLIHRVSVSPDGQSIACGTGKWVLDSMTPAQASVFIWDLRSDDCVAERKLPGCCVTSLLWISDEDRGCMYSTEFEACDQIIMATTIARNQSRGFVVVMDAFDLRMLQIEETPDASILEPIQVWPEDELIYAGGMRDLGYSSFLVPSRSQYPGFPTQRTKAGNDIWLDANHVFRLHELYKDSPVAQVLELAHPEFDLVGKCVQL